MKDAREDLLFLLSNRIPRRSAARWMAWYGGLEIGWLTRLSIALWRRFAPELDLREARTQQFRSVHECFTRELRPGARPIDPDPRVVVSPCDAIVGACGRVAGTRVFQTKGFPYGLRDLLVDDERAERHREGCYATLRLKASMYHRFHAPFEGRVRRVDHVPGDAWNVNPIALRRVPRLYCRNERAVVHLALEVPEDVLTLVAVGAILVGSIRVHCLDQRLDQRLDVRRHARRRRTRTFYCDARVRKGDEMGLFEHGSTIVLFASERFELCPGVTDGARIRVGAPLLRRT